MDRCKAVRWFARSVNRLPVPWWRWSVRVNGLRMTAHTADRFLALWLWRWGRIEAAGLHALRQRLKPGMRVADVGANIGVYALPMARAVGPLGRVWAFEPDPGNADSLERNVALNAFGNVEVVRKAVGAGTGTGCLYIDEAHHGDHRMFPSRSSTRNIPVDVVALDDYFAPDAGPELVKIDVQGAEKLVLKGMQRILSTMRGLVLLIELSIGDPVAEGDSAQWIIAHLESLGYTFVCLNERSPQIQSPLSGAELVRKIKADTYVNVVAIGP